MFDSGATHSFIARSFMHELGLKPESLPTPLQITTPVGRSIILDLYCRGVIVRLDGFSFRVDLVVLSMIDYDVIIGMDCMSTCRVSLDCFARTVTFSVPGQDSIVVATSQGNSLAEAFLALMESKEVQFDLADTPVVSEF